MDDSIFRALRLKSGLFLTNQRARFALDKSIIYDRDKFEFVDIAYDDSLI